MTKVMNVFPTPPLLFHTAYRIAASRSPWERRYRRFAVLQQKKVAKVLHLLARPAPMFEIAPVRCRRLTMIADRRAQDCVAGIETLSCDYPRPAMSSVLSNSPLRF
jgi:hypothetical protein